MTEMQREQLIELRNQGVSYGKIAEKLSLSKNTVKSYCQRHNLTPTQTPSSQKNAEPSSFCRLCGKPLTHTDGRKTLKFCSAQCRVLWWNSHLDQVNKKAFYHFSCQCCGKQFSAYGNSKRKYCSHSCYINHRFKGGDSCDKGNV